MTVSLSEGIPVALAAAVFYNSAPVLQAIAARNEPPGRRVGLGLLAHLARRRIWLAGLGCEIAGFVLEAVALSVAPLTIVQPVIALGMVLLLVVGSRVLHERLRPAGIAAASMMVLGVVVVVLSLGQHMSAEQPADGHDLLVVTVVAAATVLGGVVAAAVGGAALRPLALALAAGGCYGVASVFTRQVGLVVSERGLGHLFVTAAPYLLAAVSVVAIALLQRALQAGRAVVAYPAVEASSDICAITLGLTLLGEQVPAGWPTAGFVVGLTLIVAGLFIAGRQGGVRIAHG